MSETRACALEPLERRVLLSAELLTTHFDSDAGAENNSGGAQISVDGSAVIFSSFATDLIEGITEQNFAADLYWFDLNTGERKLVTHELGSQTTTPGDVGGVAEAHISGDGRWVVFTSGSQRLTSDTDNNGTLDVFLWSAQTGEIQLVSKGLTAGAAGGSGVSINADGSLITFGSDSRDLIPDQSGTYRNVFLYNRLTDSMTLISHSRLLATMGGFGTSFAPQISGDGSTIVFNSQAVDLIDGLTDLNNATDVFAYDIASESIRLVSGVGGSQTQVANGQSTLTSISADGSVVVFETYATNLQPGVIDANNRIDPAYAHLNGAVTPAYLNVDNGQTRFEDAQPPSLSSDGTRIAFGVFDPALNQRGVHDLDLSTDTHTFTPGVFYVSISNRRMIWRTTVNDLESVNLADRSIMLVEPASGVPDYTDNAMSDAGDLAFRAKRGSIFQILLDRFAVPIAEANGPYQVNENGTVQLSSAGSTDSAGGTNLTYAWDLDGDGVFGESGAEAMRGDEDRMNPIFNAAGTDGPVSFEVALRVTDVAGVESIDTAMVNVVNVAPTLSNVPAQVTVQLGDLVTLPLMRVADPGVGETLLATVNWGDGIADDIPLMTTVTAAGTFTSFTVDHLYLNAGSYTVEVFVVDDDEGLSNVARVQVSVDGMNDEPPIADAGGPYAASEGDDVPLQAVDSSDAETPLEDLIIVWDLDGDGVFGETGIDAEAGDEVGVFVVYDRPSDGPVQVPVTVRVTDSAGQSRTDSTTIALLNVAPALDLGVVGDRTIEQGEPVLLAQPQVFDPGFNEVLTYRVDWGDGTTTDGNGNGVPDGNGGTVGSLLESHTYAAPGVYQVTVTYRDDDAGVITATGKVTVNQQPPALSVADAQLVEGDDGTSQMIFTVSLDRASDDDVTFRFQTADIDARDGDDYTGVDETYTIVAGSTSIDVPVTILGDGIVEDDEPFAVTLIILSGATAGDLNAVGTIINDDRVRSFSSFFRPNGLIWIDKPDDTPAPAPLGGDLRFDYDAHPEDTSVPENADGMNFTEVDIDYSFGFEFEGDSWTATPIGGFRGVYTETVNDHPGVLEAGTLVAEFDALWTNQTTGQTLRFDSPMDLTLTFDWVSGPEPGETFVIEGMPQLVDADSGVATGLSVADFYLAPNPHRPMDEAELRQIVEDANAADPDSLVAIDLGDVPGPLILSAELRLAVGFALFGDLDSYSELDGWLLDDCDPMIMVDEGATLYAFNLALTNGLFAIDIAGAERVTLVNMLIDSVHKGIKVHGGDGLIEMAHVEFRDARRAVGVRGFGGNLIAVETRFVEVDRAISVRNSIGVFNWADTTITDFSGLAIAVRGGMGMHTFDGLTVNGTGTGMYLDAPDATVSIANATVDVSGGDALSVPALGKLGIIGSAFRARQGAAASIELTYLDLDGTTFESIDSPTHGLAIVNTAGTAVNLDVSVLNAAMTGVVIEQTPDALPLLGDGEPALGNVPTIGGLFRSASTRVNNREMVIFITAHLVSPIETERAEAAVVAAAQTEPSLQVITSGRGAITQLTLHDSMIVADGPGAIGIDLQVYDRATLVLNSESDNTVVADTPARLIADRNAAVLGHLLINGEPFPSEKPRGRSTSELARLFGSFVPALDVNGDGVINAFDLVSEVSNGKATERGRGLGGGHGHILAVLEN